MSTKNKTLTPKEKLLWNQAIRAAANEAYLYDGLIPDEKDRLAMKIRTIEKLSYKLNNKQP